MAGFSEILKELGSKRQVRVNQLAKALFASEMTIRRDLEYLEQEGFLTRCHGGAVPLGNHGRPDVIIYNMLINILCDYFIAFLHGPYTLAQRDSLCCGRIMHRHKFAGQISSLPGYLLCHLTCLSHASEEVELSPSIRRFRRAYCVLLFAKYRVLFAEIRAYCSFIAPNRG